MKDDPDCPVRDVLRRVTDGWSSLVLRELSRGRLRFSAIERSLLDISRRMLAKTLRSLEEDGLVLRTVHPTKPPSVEYELTDLGQSFVPHLMGMAAWAFENHDRIRAARAQYSSELA